MVREPVRLGARHAGCPVGYRNAEDLSIRAKWFQDSANLGKQIKFRRSCCQSQLMPPRRKPTRDSLQSKPALAENVCGKSWPTRESLLCSPGRSDGESSGDATARG